MENTVFRIHRAPAYAGALRPYTIYINGEAVGWVKNGGTLEVPALPAPRYFLEKDGPFGVAVSLTGRGLCSLELHTAGGCGAPNGQDAVARAGFYLAGQEIGQPAIYEKLRAAHRDAALREALTETERPLFVVYAFWQRFWQALAWESELAMASGLEQAIQALETVGAGETAAFCRAFGLRELRPGVYDLPAERPNFRKDLTGAVHRYILKNDL